MQKHLNKVTGIKNCGNVKVFLNEKYYFAWAVITHVLVFIATLCSTNRKYPLTFYAKPPHDGQSTG
jgi:hypothetical protein